jgi:hypothetical protein
MRRLQIGFLKRKATIDAVAGHPKSQSGRNVHTQSSTQLTIATGLAASRTVSQSLSFFDKLPGELRNAIYEALIDSIVNYGTAVSNFDEHTYPYYRFSFPAYMNMICTCRSIHQELSSIFRKDYLPQLIFAFDSVAGLRRFRDLCARTNLRDEHVRIALRNAWPRTDRTRRFHPRLAVMPTGSFLTSHLTRAYPALKPF